MFNHTIFVFIIGWVLWFIIDKHPASLGTIVPGEFDNLLDNFQLAFDMLEAGFVKASYIFIWKAHYIVLSIIAGLLSSILFQGISNIMRRRKLHEVMWPKKTSPEKSDNTDGDEPS
jgi:hypothetical protein